MTMLVKAGTPQASPEKPLMGMMISLDPRLMRDLALEMETATDVSRKPGSAAPQLIGSGTLEHGLH